MFGEDSAYLAARLALLALRSSLPRNVIAEHDRVVILPSEDVLTDDEAARVLAQNPKPLYCAVRVQGRDTVIHCSRIDREKTDFANIVELDQHCGAIGGIRSAVSDDLSLIMVAGRGERMLLPLKTVERWYQEYYIPFLVISSGEPDPSVRKLGAEYAVMLSASEGADLEAAPADLQAHIGALSIEEFIDAVRSAVEDEDEHGETD